MENNVKKLIIFLILAMFFVISCSSSQKSDNDADARPDEDIPDYDEEEDDEEEEYVLIDGDENYGDDKGSGWEKEPETDSPCENFANTDGMIRYKKDGSFECGCAEGYFWAHLGCKKITYSNFCTGQKKCYDWYNYTHQCADAGNLSGQDPHYSGEGYCLKQKFSNKIYYDDETITIDNNLHISWADAISTSAYTWEGAFKYCEDLKYGGRDDWRVPLPEELAVSPGNIPENITLWSSLSPDSSTSFAWLLNDRGNFELRNKSIKAHVRCVRGKSLAEDDPVLSGESRFQTIQINNVEVIKDLKSGIIWQKNFPDPKFWSDGLVFCEHSDFAGFSDWRLPNIHELFFLKDFRKGSIFLFDATLATNNPNFWSSTTAEIYENLPAYGLEFPGGRIVYMSREQYGTIARVICIKDDPCMEGYWWNGKKCAKSPCDKKPCDKIKHSDGTCGTKDFESYYCGCNEGYFWDGEKCANPCEEKPCAKHKHATEKCKAINDSSYICGCEENYYWWGTKKGCLEKQPPLAKICTGQTGCYNEVQKIECPAEGEDFYGQDAQYAKLETCVPKNYELDNSVQDEPLVYDLNTGLEWQGKIPQGAYFSWSSVNNYCSTLDYAGHDDWRLPTFSELRTILDFDTIPLVSGKYFPGTPAESFWTSTESTILDRVYAVNFETAAFGEFDLIDSYSGQEYARLSGLRCVRGDLYEIEPRHMVGLQSGEETFYGDSAMGLIWTKIIPDDSERFTWISYLKYCEDLNALGISNWRLANVNELHAVSLRERFVDFGISSTTQPANPERIFGGSSDYKDFNRPANIVCVTDIPCADGEMWTGEKCVADKCRHDVCATAGNSTGLCLPGEGDDTGYSCECKYGYVWDGAKLKCVIWESDE